MNIFVLDEDPKRAAMYHCDKHVVKMITEYSQIISSTHIVKNSPQAKKDFVFELSFKNHPCTKWARESRTNYLWLRTLLRELIEEYDFRWGKKDSFVRSRQICLLDPPETLEDIGLTPFALAMPEECKIFGNAVESYRKYYKIHKKSFAKWTKREIPEWFAENKETIL